MSEVEEDLMSRNGSKLINLKRREDMMVEDTKVQEQELKEEKRQGVQILGGGARVGVEKDLNERKKVSFKKK